MLEKKLQLQYVISEKNKRIKNKNFKKYTMFLYQITLNKLLKCKFDKIYVDTDSEEKKIL